MRISDWSSDVCSSDLRRLCRLQSRAAVRGDAQGADRRLGRGERCRVRAGLAVAAGLVFSETRRGHASGGGARMQGNPGVARHIRRLHARQDRRSEEHTSELQSLMRTSYAVFCLKKKKENIEKQQNKT